MPQQSIACVLLHFDLNNSIFIMMFRLDGVGFVICKSGGGRGGYLYLSEQYTVSVSLRPVRMHSRTPDVKRH